MNKTKKQSKGISIIKGQTKNLSNEKYEFCFDMYLKGYKSGEIQKAFAEKFDDTDRNARNYLSKVKKNIKEKSDSNRLLMTNTVTLRYEYLYNKLLEQGKYKEAAEVMNQMVRLLGIEAPKKMEVTNTNVNTLDLSKLPQDMIDRLLNEGFTDAEVVE